MDIFPALVPISIGISAAKRDLMISGFNSALVARCIGISPLGVGIPAVKGAALIKDKTAKGFTFFIIRARCRGR
jgi:hypothetical protein